MALRVNFSKIDVYKLRTNLKDLPGSILVSARIKEPLFSVLALAS